MSLTNFNWTTLPTFTSDS